ncbi:ATP-dependent helicase, partial [Phocaeicola vulgatus]|nr:ATP-dependent helicase [Phocaeicola vulgatus]
WAAMFEGRMIGNALSRARAETGRLSVSGPLPEDERQREDELEVVITHDRLMDFLTSRKDSATETGGQPVLKSYYDRQSGLWGLRRGERMTVRPRYSEVFDICGDRAAVRFGNNRAGVVNETGQPGIQLDRCRKMKFMKGDLLAVTDCAGNESYIDLKVNRTYREKPVVLSFGCMELPYGGVELLKVGAFFFSRTGKPYVSMRGVDQNGIYFYDFYLKIPDYRVPKDCQLVDPVWTTLFDVFACVLAGDEEEVYWCCGRLADRSIVVMDGNGNYYHVEKGKEKRYIACNTPRPGEEDFHTVMERLKEEAGRRAGIAQRKQLQEEEQKRLKRLEEIRDALPFRMGMKWGLKLGERIIVPPKYRKILPPVGYYCAYEENACQWGIMALDGKVVVEARYQKVDIECNGTVHLTVIPGKVKTIKL